MERITGFAPPKTCPWKAFYDPLVADVLSLFWAIEDGNLAILGSDPDAAFVTALGVLKGAFRATLNEEQRILDAERKQKAEAAKNR